MEDIWRDRGMEPISGASYSAAELAPNNRSLLVLDQRRLPLEEHYVDVVDVEGAARAIRDMLVRGAPAIGITAAYGMVLAAGSKEVREASAFLTRLEADATTLARTRPTAVNLTWALGRMMERAREVAPLSPPERCSSLAALARAIHREDVAACRQMARYGAERLAEYGRGLRVLTHCNAGALATGGYGTALGVIREAVARGIVLGAYSSETRPYLQGARLTTWELHRDGIDVTAITDNAVAHHLKRGRIQAVVVGADRIAKNGDTANKIGTYGIAIAARHHEIPMLVAAPWSTVDRATETGDDIVIEERSGREVSHVGDYRLVPEGVGIQNPAFDVTPAALITAIITERGVFAPAQLASA